MGSKLRQFINILQQQSRSTVAKVLLIIGMFITICIVQVALVYVQGNIFDGVRTYVRGEGLWAKAQKDATFYLIQYSYHKNEVDYQRYLAATAVMQGDKQAREALLSSPINQRKAREGFIQGLNDDRDTESLIWFFRHFNRTHYMQQAVKIWGLADDKFSTMMSLASAMHQEINLSGGNAADLSQYREKIIKLSEELLSLEIEFSAVLSEGARWVKRITWLISLSVLLLFISIGVLASRQIIRNIAKSEKLLLISESRFNSLKDSDTIGIISWQLDGTIHDANDHFLNMLGFDREDLASGRVNWRSLTPPEFEARDQIAIAELIELGHCNQYEKQLISKTGAHVSVMLGASFLNSSTHEGVAYFMDLTSSKQAEDKLRLAATVFNASTDGIIITDPLLSIISINQAFTDITGLTEQDLHQDASRFINTGHPSEDAYQAMLNLLQKGEQWQGELIKETASGYLPLSVRINTVRNQDNRLTHFVIVITDISERKAEEEHLRHIAHHDALTNLPNRVLFHTKLEQAIVHAQRSDGIFAILFLDLDNFKPVNDEFGHDVGDKLLQEVAKRLTGNIRQIDTITRLGGDEFVILLEHLPNEESVPVLTQKITQAVTAPYIIHEHKLRIGVSIGSAIFPCHGTDAKTLINYADQAMYAVKKANKLMQSSQS
ncbi:sensor domain-containing diguanylate cyclase [Shewanella seohaensis]|uniref:sensor domain-containing diguanylate cyclase n=1 Tax=Shewanella seohaensis TaxID=755175 RepID=UPI002010B743|nr:sensor domain-containing diguanylate cyclase [Shewanella seohaensis]MCL1119797.1 sensor domain-containing diguanylate cyclase [Shewanella seohaensis]UXM83008.1 sensor domain-containing diguanylate cyclase [Shewanella seohaensis]